MYREHCGVKLLKIKDLNIIFMNMILSLVIFL